MKWIVSFYINQHLVRGYKAHNEFHKYSMNWKFLSDSLYNMSNDCKKIKILSSFITHCVRLINNVNGN